MLKINIIQGHFSSRMSFKMFSDKIFLGNNMTYLLEKHFFKKYVQHEDNNSFKGFKFFIFRLPVFFHSQMFQCSFLSFENFKLQSFKSYLSTLNIYKTFTHKT